MKIERIWSIYFSPTGGTKKIVNLIAETIGKCLQKDVIELDYTRYDHRKKIYSFNREDLVILGMPVYAGRIPNKILPDIESDFKGNKAMLIPVSVYGNRNFDDALMELKLVLENQGFQAIAAAAIVSPHAFSTSLAAGRPDQTDVEEIRNFAKQTAKYLTETDKIFSVTVMGNNPVAPYYTPLTETGSAAKFLKAKPITDLAKCDHCGICAQVCPMQSISHTDCTSISGICIKCQACIRKCPQQAKLFIDEDFLSHVRMLEKNYHRRANNYFFF